MEQARAIKNLLDAGLSMEQVCKNCALAENTIKARLSLLSKEEEMPEVIEAIDKGEITFSTGEILSRISNQPLRVALLDYAKKGASGSEILKILELKINKNHVDPKMYTLTIHQGVARYDGKE